MSDGLDSALWPRPLQAGTDDPMAAILDPPVEPDSLPAYDHDLAELRAVERVVAILVRRSRRSVRREILQAIDDTEVHP